MHCDYPGAGRTAGNVIRDSISINDGRKKKGPAYGFGFVAWGSGLDDCQVSNCLALVTASERQDDREGAFFVSRLPGSAFGPDDLHIRGCRVEDSIACVSSAGIPLVSSSLPKLSPEDVAFERNAYGAVGGDPLFLEANRTYASLEAWRRATGQETRLGKSTARPATLATSISAAADYRLKSPRDLPEFALFKSLVNPAR
jgi:hypothetical protein